MSNPMIRGLIALVVVCALPLTWAGACPFCSAVSTTLSEDIKANDAVVIAKLVKRSAPPPAVDADGQASTLPLDASKATFEIVSVIKGREQLGALKQIDVLYFGQHPPEQHFLIYGVDPKDWAWTTPNPLSTRAVEYVKAVAKLPESGPERLVYFQDFFEDSDALLAGDAYDEFAKAPYADIQAIKDKMQREKLLKFLNSSDTSTSHRRLYLTMLGVCGGQENIAALEAMIRNEDRQIRMALDAMVSCYLNLKGVEGLPLVEELFLKNLKAEYTDTYATIMALRFHGQEVNIIPRERLTQALRYMLDRPQLADLVIPDLARWQDWSAMDKLVKLFKEADDDSVWVRVPVINYLRACPLPEAKQHIEELKLVDADAVKRASQYFPIGAGARPAPAAEKPENNAAQAPAPATPTDAPSNNADKAKKPDTEKKPSADASKTRPAATTALKPVATDELADDEADNDDKGVADEAANLTRVAATGKGRFSPIKVVSDSSVGPLTVILWAVVASSLVLLLLVTIFRGNRQTRAI